MLLSETTPIKNTLTTHAGMSLEMALDVLYVQHNGEPFSVDIFTWVMAEAIAEVPLRTLLAAIPRKGYADYSVVETQVDIGIGHPPAVRKWRVYIFKAPPIYNLYIKLQPPTSPDGNN